MRENYTVRLKAQLKATKKIINSRDKPLCEKKKIYIFFCYLFTD